MQHFRLMAWNWAAPPNPTSSPPKNTTSTDDPGSSENDGAATLSREARAKCLEIVSTTERILSAANARFGPVFNTLMMPQSGILAASFLLAGNIDSAREEHILLQIMGILVRCSRQRNLVKGVTHMLLKTSADQAAAHAGEETPPGGVSASLVERMTVVVEDLAWEEPDPRSFSSSYPNHVKVKGEPEEDVELSSMLEKWASLDVHREE
jgi:hypothetical protein